jgi:hypothetical protein
MIGAGGSHSQLGLAAAHQADQLIASAGRQGQLQLGKCPKAAIGQLLYCLQRVDPKSVHAAFFCF